MSCANCDLIDQFLHGFLNNENSVFSNFDKLGKIDEFTQLTDNPQTWVQIVFFIVRTRPFHRILTYFPG